MVKCNHCSFSVGTTQGLREKPACCGKKKYVCPKCGHEMILSKGAGVVRVVGHRQAVQRIRR